MPTTTLPPNILGAIMKGANSNSPGLNMTYASPKGPFGVQTINPTRQEGWEAFHGHHLNNLNPIQSPGVSGSLGNLHEGDLSNGIMNRMKAGGQIPSAAPMNQPGPPINPYDQAMLQQQMERARQMAHKQRMLEHLMSIVPDTLEEHGIGASGLPNATGGGSTKKPFETDTE